MPVKTPVGAWWEQLGSCWNCRRRVRQRKTPGTSTTAIEPKQRPVRAAELQKAVEQTGKLAGLATRITVSSWEEFITWRWEDPLPSRGSDLVQNDDPVEFATCWDLIWDLQYELQDLLHLIQDVRGRADRASLWVRGDRVEPLLNEDRSPEQVLSDSYIAAANCLEERHVTASRRRKEIVNAWVAYSGLKYDFPVELCYLIFSNLDGIAHWRTRDHPRCNRQECDSCRSDEKVARRRQADLKRRGEPL